MGGVSLLLFMRHSALRHTRVDTERSIALFWLAPAGFRRFIVSCSVKTLSGLLVHVKLCTSRRLRLSRIITGNRPYRFCAIAVTLATRTCVRLRARWVGGLSSAALKLPSAALSLSRQHMRERTLIMAQVTGPDNDFEVIYPGDN